MRFTLVNASQFTTGPNHTVGMCKNAVGNNYIDPKSLLYPPSLSDALLQLCTFSLSLSLTVPLTLTLTTPQSYSVSATSSRSASISVSRTQSLSTQSLPTHSASNSLSSSSSHPYTISLFTLSSSLSGLGSLTRSRARTGTAEWHTSTFEGGSTPSISYTLTCQDQVGLDLNQTCSVLRPLMLVTESSSAHLAENSSSCSSVKVPYSTWAGRTGSEHSLTFAAMDHRVPLRTTLPAPTINKPNLLESGDGLPGSQAVLLGANSTSAVNFTTATVIVRYLGAPTMNQIQYTLGCEQWSRCPVITPLNFYITLQAAERLMPVPVANAVYIGSAIAVVGGSTMVSPASVAQLSVVSSLRSMSRCVSTDLDANDAVEEFDEYSGGRLNPFGIGVGEGGEVRAHVRGSLAMSAVYLLVLSLLMLAHTTVSARLAKLDQRNGSRNNEENVAPSILGGYPSALVAVCSFAMDGAISAGVIMGSERGSSWGDRLVGWAAVLLCALYVGHIIIVTTTFFPASIAAAAIAPPPLIDDDTAPNRARRWLTSPTHSWKPTNKAANRWMHRYESYVADLRVPWYCGLEQAVAMLVCVLATLPLADLTICVVRGVTCALFLGCQAAVILLMKPMVHKWRWLLFSSIQVCQTVSAVLAAANAPLQDTTVELGMDSLGVIVFLLTAISTIADAIPLIESVYKTATRLIAACKRCLGAESSAENHSSDLSLTLLLETPQPSPAEENDITTTIELGDLRDTANADMKKTLEGEALIVQQVLADFVEYERSGSINIRAL